MSCPIRFHRWPSTPSEWAAYAVHFHAEHGPDAVPVDDVPVLLDEPMPPEMEETLF